MILPPVTLLFSLFCPLAHSAPAMWASSLFLRHIGCFYLKSPRRPHGSDFLQVCLNVTFWSRSCHALIIDLALAIPASGFLPKASATFYIKAFSTVGAYLLQRGPKRQGVNTLRSNPQCMSWWLSTLTSFPLDGTSLRHVVHYILGLPRKNTNAHIDKWNQHKKKMVGVISEIISKIISQNI